MTRFGLGFQGRYRPTPAELADIAAGINGNDIYTKLLLRTTHNIYDASVPGRGNAVLAGGTTFITGAASKFLGSSALFDGVDDYLYFADHADFAYGTSDFTIEAFIYLTGAPSIHHTIVSQNTDNAYNKLFGFYVMSDGTLLFELRNSGGAPANLVTAGSAPGTITNNVWTHVALVRSGSNWTAYKNGVAVATAVYAGAFPDFAAPLMFGELAYANWYFKGYIGEARISHIARWTETFTPPIGPYQYESIGGNDNFTKLLLHMNGSQGQTAWIDQSPYGVATPPSNLNIEFMVVGGGGGGGASSGWNAGGGGGAGAAYWGTYTLGPGNYNVTIGAGGAPGGNYGNNAAANGGVSWFHGAGVNGGGGGASVNSDTAAFNGANGGSGGGGSQNVSGIPGAGGAPLDGNGNYGGTSTDGVNSGGGGGRGGAGGNYWGGAGVVLGYSGASVEYARGGNGKNSYEPSAVWGENAPNYTGNGGGGSASLADGGWGGHGIAIARYLGAQKANGGTITSVGGYTIHTFTGSGTFAVIDTSQLTGNKGYATRGGDTYVTQAGCFNGSSTYFDGAGDYLQYGDSTDWTADADWTCDVRLYITEYPAGASAIFSQNDGANLQLFTIGPAGGLGYLQRQPSDTGVNTANGVILLNRWHHVALVRSGTNCTIYVDGLAAGAGVFPAPVNLAGAFQIGTWGGSYPFKGYMSEFRISKGAGGGARWTSNFTPPRAPYGVQGNDGYTTLLAHFDTAVPGAVGFVMDSSKSANALNSYTAMQEHGTAKWGHSFYFPGNSWVQWPITADLQLGGADFTFDWWQYPTNDADHGVWAQYTDANNRAGFFRFAGGLGQFQIYIGSVMQVALTTASGVFPPNAYCHVAVVRSGNNWTLYKDGIAVASAVSAYVVPAIGQLWLGGGWYNAGQLYPYVGLIEEFRLSKKARWTTNFVPPQIPYFGAVGSISANL